MTSPDRTSGSHGSGLVAPLLAERSRVSPERRGPCFLPVVTNNRLTKNPGCIHPQISPYDITLWPPPAPPASLPAV